MYHRRQHCETS